jgi:hypothetical protein
VRTDEIIPPGMDNLNVPLEVSIRSPSQGREIRGVATHGERAA